MGTKKIRQTKIRKRLGDVSLEGIGQYLAFDISSLDTGYSVYKKSDGGFLLTESGSLPVKGKNAAERFPEMVRRINNKIDEVKPDLILCEESFFRVSFDSIEYPLKLQGFIEGKCVMEKRQFASVPIPTWRSLLSFPSNFQKRKSSYKDLSKEFASEIAGKIITDDNEADAVCIGKAAAVFFEGKDLHSLRSEE